MYLRGDKTWANFTAEVLNAPLSTYVLDATTKPSVGVTDKIGPALGKIQKFLNDLNTDYVSKTATLQTVTGTFSFTSPTSFLYTQLPSGASPTEVSNVQYVQNYVGAAVSGLSSTAPAVLTTASGGAAAGDTTLNVVSTTGYPTSGTLKVGSEAISYTGATGTSFTGLTRGAYGTTASSISNGDSINNYLFLSRSTNTSTPKMVVTGSGNVGIGTANPVALLDVAGDATFGDGSGTRSVTINAAAVGAARGAYKIRGSGLGNPSWDMGTNLSSNKFELGYTYSVTRTPRLIVDNVGNVGIGTSAPMSLLQVSKAQAAATEIKIENRNTMASSGSADLVFNGYRDVQADYPLARIRMQPSASAGAGNAATNGNLVFMTAGYDTTLSTLERMRIDYAGNVGIGTPSPASLLDISSTTGAIQTLSRNNDTVALADSIGQIQFNNNDSQLVTQKTFGNIEVLADQAITSDAAAGLMIFRTTGTTVAGAPAERMRINSAGRVAIGIANPTSRFHVYDTSGSAAIHGAVSSGAATGVYGYTFGSNSLWSGGGVTGQGTNGVRGILNYGGIGNTGAALIGQSSAIVDDGQLLKLQHNTSAFSGTAFLSNMATGTGSFTGNFLDFKNNGITKFIVKSDGNIGIGSSDTFARLDVSDTSTTSSAIIVPRAGNFTGSNVNGMIRYNTDSTLFEFYQNGTWVNYTTVSDGRLKTNVEPVTDGLGIVSQLKPVFYDWDRTNPKASNFENKHQLGFIAQEVEKIIPEVVNKGEDGYRSVEYGKIVAVVVAAVKELYNKFINFVKYDNEQERKIASKADKSEVDQLKTEIAAKGQRIIELEERLLRIEKSIKSK